MVKIRLQKRGKKNAPSYKIVVADSKSPRDGKYIEEIGYYNPSMTPEQFEIDKDKYQSWMDKGAKPSDAVVKLVEGDYEFVEWNTEEEEGKKEPPTGEESNKDKGANEAEDDTEEEHEEDKEENNDEQKEDKE